MSQFQHLTLNQGTHDTVLLTLNVKDNSTNVLTLAVLKELNEAIGGIRDKGFKGLVIRSAKANHFIQGADTDTLLALETPQATDAYINLGNQICRRIRELPFPTIALIEGSCFNAGWDIALSCQYRIASDESVISYNHYQQGFYAGFGGITRLVSHLGLTSTLTLLTKETHTAEQLKSLRLIDHCVPSYKTQAVVNFLFQQYRDNESLPQDITKPHRSNTFIPRQARLLSMKRNLPIVGNSPSEQQASRSIIETWVGHNVTEESYLNEAKAAIELLHKPATQFQLNNNQLKQTLNINLVTLGNDIRRVHIIGSGTIGRYIARLCAQNNFVVTLCDTRNSALEKLLPELNQYFAQEKISPDRQQRIKDNINLSQENYGLPHADIVIEATPEGCLAKTSLLKDTESNAKPTALLFTSSACLPLEELSKNMVSPERLALFNPYHPCLKSDLVEVSTHGDNDSLATIQSFAKSLALTPIPVKSAAGYLGTRLMMAFLTEAMLIHQSGASISAIDKQALKMGMRHAPFELIDNIGITECLRVTEALADRRGIDVPNVLIHKKEHGLEGKRSGAGFYRYKNGVKHDSLLNHKLSTSHKRLKPAAIEQRIIEKIINEARACLKEGLVEDEAILDLVASLTTGFPVKHGGPLSYLKTIQTANKTITQ